MKKHIAALFFAAGFSLAVSTAHAQSSSLVVQAGAVKHAIPKTMWGVFFEDINMGADGGIYAELVKNRSFEFFQPLMGWTVQRKKYTEGEVLVLNRKEKNTRNPRYIQLTATNAVMGDLGLTNEGFRGMGIKKSLPYDFSLMYRQPQKGLTLHVQLVDSTGAILGQTTITPPEAGGPDWHKAAVRFTTGAGSAKAKLNLWVEGTGVIELDMVSLFPGDTWKGRPGGMRADMVQMLADMKPGFIRFPGGCIVEGYDLSQRYQWKNTVGPIEERQLLINRWNFEFDNRPAPDYFQTFGLGFFEYFQLCEDVGAAPLPILNAGMACQFNSAEVVPLDDLNPYVQDALDLIEFANGDTSSTWGKVRARMGHPAPFNLTMLGVGNENWGPQYVARLKVFEQKLKEAYPNIKLIFSGGTGPDGQRFNYLDSTLRGMQADYIDEHYYQRPAWFLKNAARYDNYPRTGTKVFAGEYAAHPEKVPDGNAENNWGAALAEAAYMTGLERNSDVVHMASYAPLFAHTDAWQWAPDLIWVDNVQVYGTPNYYVQKLYATNRGTNVVPLLLDGKPLTGQDSLYASAAIDKTTNELIVKLVNVSGQALQKNLKLEGIKSTASKASMLVLKSTDLQRINSFAAQTAVSPVAGTVAVKNKSINLAVAPYSFTVLRVKMQ